MDIEAGFDSFNHSVWISYFVSQTAEALNYLQINYVFWHVTRVFFVLIVYLFPSFLCNISHFPHNISQYLLSWVPFSYGLTDNIKNEKVHHSVREKTSRRTSQNSEIGVNHPYQLPGVWDCGWCTEESSKGRIYQHHYPSPHLLLISLWGWL